MIVPDGGQEPSGAYAYNCTKCEQGGHDTLDELWACEGPPDDQIALDFEADPTHNEGGGA